MVVTKCNVIAFWYSSPIKYNLKPLEWKFLNISNGVFKKLISSNFMGIQLWCQTRLHLQSQHLRLIACDMLTSSIYTKHFNYFTNNSTRMSRIILTQYAPSSKEFPSSTDKIKNGFFPFKRQVKSRLPSSGIIRSSPYSPR